MIRYSTATRAELEALVDAHDANFRAKGAAATALFVAAGKYDNKHSAFWSDVKPVFMTLQKNKCIFCERVLGALLTGKAEHDVEHYRPKGRIKAWPYAKRKPFVKYDFPVGEKRETGYHWLAYDVENYACACKGCNSDRKSDYFPVRGVRGVASTDVAALKAAEKPLILFPQGANGDDPADYITFDGILAVPLPQDVERRRRAQVTIDFFSLNDREELLADRARAIGNLFKAVRMSRTDPDPAIRASAKKDIDVILMDAAPQAACVRAFHKLMLTDFQRAFEIYREVERYLSKTGQPAPAH